MVPGARDEALAAVPGDSRHTLRVPLQIAPGLLGYPALSNGSRCCPSSLSTALLASWPGRQPFGAPAAAKKGAVKQSGETTTFLSFFETRVSARGKRLRKQEANPHL